MSSLLCKYGAPVKSHERSPEEVLRVLATRNPRGSRLGENWGELERRVLSLANQDRPSISGCCLSRDNVGNASLLSVVQREDHVEDILAILARPVTVLPALLRSTNPWTLQRRDGSFS